MPTASLATPPQLKILNLPVLIEHICFVALGVLAIIFFEERLVADSGYYTFRVINEERFWIEHNRHILALSQLFTLLAVKIGLNLKAILILNSLGHVLFFYGVYLLSRFVFIFQPAGMMLILFQVLGIMSGFFVPMFELYYAAALLVLLVAIIYDHGFPRKGFSYLIIPVLSFFILGSHLFALPLFLFLVAIHFFEQKKKNWRLYVLLALCILSMILLKRFTTSGYEHVRMEGVLSNFTNGRINLGYFSGLAPFLFTHYKSLILVTAASIMLFLLQKKFLLAGTAFISFLLLLFAVSVSYIGFTQSRYQEQVYFPLSVVAGSGLAYSLAYFSLNIQRFLWLAVLCIVGIRLFFIVENSQWFHARITEMKAVIAGVEEQHGKKWVIREDILKYDPNWSWPLESMLFSSLDGKEHTINICTETDFTFQDNHQKIKRDEFLFRRWEIYPVSKLNENYFQLPSGAYKYLQP